MAANRRTKEKRYRKQIKWMTAIVCMEMICIVCLLGVFVKRAQTASAQTQSDQVVIQENDIQSTEEQQMDVLSKDQEEETEETEKTQEEEREEILLVNKDHPLPDDYSVKLIRLPDRTNRSAEEAYEPLMDMLSAGREEGLSFEICSSYRDVDRQQELFDEDVAALMRRGYTYQEAYDEVARETMPPGHSEHSTGLAFDIVSLSYQMLDAAQERTAESIWLREHCAEYGFILRYPKDKEDITGISYESWHFRYVGVEIAEYIMENELTLEEYLEENS